MASLRQRLLHERIQEAAEAAQQTTAAQRLAILRPDLGTRTLLIGTTRSGKSVLECAMLDYLSEQHIVILDPKNDFDFPGAKISTTPESLAGPFNFARIRQYKPSHKYLTDADAWNRIFKWIFLRKNTVCVIDELPMVCGNASAFPEYLQMIYQQGAKLKITTLACSQRAARIPIFCLSESHRIAMFEVGAASDRERVGDNCHDAMRIPVLAMPGADKHCFWWWEREAGYVPFIAKYNYTGGK